MLDVSEFRPGQAIRGRATVKDGMTTPPRAFVEGDLVLIMDDIGRYAEIGREDMAILRAKNNSGSGKAGIGTARTRGEIIKKLFESGFLEKAGGKKRGGGVINPTEKGIALYSKLNDCGIAKVLISPEMTARWEEGLEKIEDGSVTVEQFTSKLEQFVGQMVADMTSNPTNPMYGKRPGSAPREPVDPHPLDGRACPKCGKGVLVTLKVMNEKSRSFGQRYVRCDARGKCDYFGEFIS